MDEPLQSKKTPDGVWDAPSSASIPTAGHDLFGRDADKQWLNERLADPKTAAALVRGGPGAGKTALLQLWLAELKEKIPPEPFIKSAGGILIVTVTKEEAQAVLEVFPAESGKNRRSIGNKTYYSLGVCSGAPVFMVQSEPGAVTPGGSLSTISQAIRELHPQAVILCGIAFGLQPERQQLGDILIAKQLVPYEPHKIDKHQGQIARGDRAAASERLLDRFRAGDNDWKGARTWFGPVLSGEKLVNDPDFKNTLLKEEPEALGGEMEGAGLYVAARAAKIDWILVKAVCDWADGDKNSDAQPLAARNAAQFVFHVVQSGGWEISEPTESLRKKYPHRIFAWSFDLHGEGDRESGSEDFLCTALASFGAADIGGNAQDRARRLAELLGEHPAIMLLDGIEALQDRDGKVHDAGLHELLARAQQDGLANNSLLVLSSHHPLPEFAKPANICRAAVQSRDLPPLSEDESMALLRCLGVQGRDRELREAAMRMEKHPLTLALMGGLLKRRYRGRIQEYVRVLRVLEEHPADKEKDPEAERARRILAFYEQKYWGKPRFRERIADWLNGESLGDEPVFLHLLGLFDGPMEEAEFNLLLEENKDKEYADLDEYLYPLRERRRRAMRAVPANDPSLTWQERHARIRHLAFGALWARLEQAGLTAPAAPGYWRCHPLVRAWFEKHFRAEYFDVWCQAQRLLYAHYLKQGCELCGDKKDPSLEQLRPFYRAVRHACQARDYGLALEIYKDHIVRWDENRELRFYSTKQLGAQARDLELLAGFFPGGWALPPPLSAADQAWLLSVVSFNLMNLGRLSEALAPMQASLKIQVKASGRKNASTAARNLSGLLLTLGRCQAAEKQARTALEHAGEDLFERIANTAYMAAALHGQGRLREAAAAFAQVEKLQARRQPSLPHLYSVWGAQYCALRLDCAPSGTAINPEKLRATADRGRYGLEHQVSKLDTALNRLTLARTHAALGETEPARAEFDKALRAVYEADVMFYAPEFLIARARFFLAHQGGRSKIYRDLNEAGNIIQRGDMDLWAVDCHLAWGEVWLTQDPDEALVHYRAAAELIEKTAYHLRDGERELLGARLCAQGVEMEHDAQQHLRAAGEHIAQTGHCALLGAWENTRDLCGLPDLETPRCESAVGEQAEKAEKSEPAPLPAVDLQNLPSLNLGQALKTWQV
ncbi:MAG: hypothetical protein GY862_03895 [Gammaproteobacteria bacterium]|nr:hypothetical protein [Gammaproteobacteria bacterium]